MEKSIIASRVILSSDLSPQFLNFWPIAAQSWRSIFGITPTLVLVSRKPISSSLMKKLNEFGDVHSLVSTSSAPLPNQAKMARWYIAGKLTGELVTIEDIDTMYLSSDYLLERLSHFQEGMLLGIGNDVNQDDPDYKGKFPASNLTGTADTFQEFFNSASTESFEEFLNRFKGMRMLDNREDPFNKPNRFSDESLIRALRENHKSELIKTIPRKVDIQTEWMDRSWWPIDGEIPKKAILVNLPRPLYNNQKRCKSLMQIYFGKSYPWMIDRKSNIWENPDHPFRLMLRKLVIVFMSKLKMTIDKNRKVTP